MKHFLIFFLFLLVILKTSAQSNEKKIIGKWKLISMCDNEGGTNILIQSNSENKFTTITFFKNNRFITHSVNKNKVECLGRGAYTLSLDSKFLFQDDKKYSILSFTNKELKVFSDNNMILIFTKQ